MLLRHERGRAENAGGLRNGQDQESEATLHNTKDEAVSVQAANQKVKCNATELASSWAVGCYATEHAT